MIDYTNPVFYTYDCRKQFEVVDKKPVNTLPTLDKVKPFYEVHIFNDGNIGLFNINSSRYLKPNIKDKKDNYFIYGLRTIKNRQRQISMHRLIGLAFIDGYQNGYFVDHNDCDKQHCHISNLEWVSHKENTQRAVKNGLGVGRPRIEKKPKVYKSKLEISQGAKNGSNGLTFDKVESIFILAKRGLNRTQIAKEIGVSQPCISQILAGKRWSDHPASILYRSMVV